MANKGHGEQGGDAVQSAAGERRTGVDRRSGPGRRADDTVDTHFALMADIAREFSDSHDVHATMKHAVERIADHLGAVGGALFLLDSDAQELVCRASYGPVELEGVRLAAGDGIVGRCVQSRCGLLVRDVAKDPNFAASIDAQSGFATRSILCAPLTLRDQCLGAVELVNKLGVDRRFDEQDLELLQALANSAALAIANARMTADLMLQERARRELELASEIQRGLLPRRRPAPFPIVGVNLPANVMSGDFYDYVDLDDGRICFALGDVSGKSVYAALLMTKTVSLFRCLAKTQPDPGVLLSIINDEVCETTTRGMFVTMVVGILDAAAGKVCLANAGHEPALLRAPDGEFTSIPADAPPLGILPGFGGVAGFPRVDVDLLGGTLYLFTDGVTEVRKPAGKMLGVAGFKRILDELTTLPISDQLDRVLERMAMLNPHDDVTVLAVDCRVK